MVSHMVRNGFRNHSQGHTAGMSKPAKDSDTLLDELERQSSREGGAVGPVSFLVSSV